MVFNFILLMVNVIDPETELTSIEMQSHAIDSSKVAICINKRQDTKRLHGVSERCFSLFPCLHLVLYASSTWKGYDSIRGFLNSPHAQCNIKLRWLLLAHSSAPPTILFIYECTLSLSFSVVEEAIK